ncbi:MAG: response regulator [Gemmatimonadetes bacterium]|uniref:Response regulator n=1 Tax=Candidatus Kutchimonas denitrificans TaxID=3056748 RepID=A0AAE5CDQ9_9BACT|nr:response regulator [Gemmatimonadota bacterium]NIR76319.1 response regulator [Candidatus Kutchimonas denitrificans]NIS02342.1 response regulator [Gemmatimonadota bacterium]NIT68161.1 response regulator [Gemmatimonadota bacterium]NIU54385.1 response regulator [Gemmatimonadota bacterium]
MDDSFQVVLIDDDPDLRKLLKLTLEFTAGWQVSAAAAGAEGIEMVRRVNPDIAVVDIMMPDMDGYEVCQRLKDDPATADIPVVFLTARKELDEARVEACGARGVVIKPFEPEELADQLRTLCGRGP